MLMSAVKDVSNQLLSEVRLSSVAGVGPLIRKRLMDAMGDAGAILNSDSSRLLSVKGVGPKIVQAIQAAPSEEEVVRLLQDANQHGIHPLLIHEPGYPRLLKQIYDPPSVLYCQGELQESDQRAIAIVGTRRATRYGIRQAESLARGLVRAGITVVSGLARGIDGAAHRAALEAGGRTIAVLGGGLMKLYPPEHRPLADDIAKQGAVLAESPPQMPPMSGSFPQRNRIISGLSLGVVVIEAAERSGALITARHAAEQGRDAFAVPGPVDSCQSLGCCRLLQEGAKLVVSVEDILEELQDHSANLPQHKVTASEPLVPPRERSPDEQTLWDAITQEPISIETLVDQTGMPIPRVLAGISLLETASEIQRVSGILVRRC